MMKSTAQSLFLAAVCLIVVGGASFGQSNPERIRVILDTDANNELDDQHAIAYLLYNGDVFDVEGITVNRTRGGGGIDRHVAEARRVVRLCGLHRQVRVFAGADGTFNEIRDTLDRPDFDGAEAVNFIIERARAEDSRQLVLLPVGKLTNIALALAKAPDIASRVRIVWLGSNYPAPGEYNQVNDEPSLNHILDDHPDVPFEIAIVRYGRPSGTDAVRATLDEIRERMPGTGLKVFPPVTGRHGGEFNNFGDYSLNLFENIRLSGSPPSRALFDMAAVAIVKNPSWARATVMPAPTLVLGEGDRGRWRDRPDNQRKITLWEDFDRDAIMEDFYDRMKNPRPAVSKEGLSIYEVNPRYLAYNDAPVFLASKSYFWNAVSMPLEDGQYRFVRDIETMAANGGNLLRLGLFWPGHGQEGGALPWVRDDETGLYDLDMFNPLYFQRLRDYISLAAQHQAVICLEVFCHPQVKGGRGRWPAHPMNHQNNRNYGAEVFGDRAPYERFFRTLPEHDNNPVALKYQQALVRKVLDETLDLWNVVYSLVNECPSPVEWNTYWSNFIKEHAAGKGVENVFVTSMWRRDLPAFDVFDAQDAQSPYRVRRMNPAGMWSSFQAIQARQQQHDRVKPVFDSGQMGGAPGTHILHQLWMSFVGGTAGMRYHRLAPVFPGRGGSEVRVGDWEDPHYLQQQRWVRNLRLFIGDMAFWTMEPLWDAVVAGEGYGFGRSGDEYVFYLPKGGIIEVASSPDMAGQYRARWFDPDTGETQDSWTLRVTTEQKSFRMTAPGEKDWVLHLRAAAEGS